MSTLLIYSTLNGFESNFSQILKKYKKKKNKLIDNVYCYYFTSMEQPMSDCRWKAFNMIVNKLGGASVNSYISDTPPVKSSIASQVLPPFNASYDPWSL